MTMTTLPTIRNILVPLDGSRLAEASLVPARAIALATGATVTLLHVLEHDAPELVHGEPHLTEEHESASYLADAARRWNGHTVFEQHVHLNPEHDIAASIAQHAAELDADLIAITTHGGGGLRGLLFGSIAQNVLQRTDRPVLITRPEHIGGPEFACRRVAVALDRTPMAAEALPLARSVATAFGAGLALISVVPTLASVRGERAVPATMLPTATSALLDMQVKETATYLTNLRDAIGDPETVALVRRGDVAGEIAAAVQETGSDLLFLSTHAKAGLEGIVSGSIAAKVLGRVHQPVVLLRASTSPAE